jgi:hypothetical protein
MIPIVVWWTKYTATVNGRVHKLVPCENCSAEYVYVLEREGYGVGTDVYSLTDDKAEEKAVSGAEESLREYLANDFDAVPCPICGHYQRFMFPKLYETKSFWGPAARVAVLVLGVMNFIGALFWTIGYLQQPSDHALGRLLVMWSLLAVLALVGFWLASVERARVRDFNPNLEDQKARIEKGRSRAMTRVEFEAAQQREQKAEGTHAE